MAEPLLSLRGVQTHIGRYHILHGVDFDVPEGGLTMLLGRNGAGKTTTLRTIMGLWRAAAGEIRFAGRDITRLATPDIARLGIAYVPESMAIFADLTVQENLAARRALGPARPQAARLDLQPLRGAEALLAAAGRPSVGRPEADAGGGARHRRAAPAAADRRADQGPGARHHRQHDRGLPRAEGRRRPACWWSSRTSSSPASSATPWR